MPARSPVRKPSIPALGVASLALVLLALMLVAVPAQAWTGASVPTPAEYNGKDAAGATGGYSLVYGSGPWTTYPSGAWANIDIACAGCGGTAWSIPDSGSGASPWSGAITLPFTFSFFGQSYTQLSAHGYGMLAFGSSPPTPDGNVWDELDYTGGAGKQWAVLFPFMSSAQHAGCTGTALDPTGHVTYKSIPATSTGANDAVFVVQFTNVVFKNGGVCSQPNSYGPSTYQVRLYQNGNAIEFHYLSATNQDPYGGANVDVGIRSSIPPAGSTSAPRYLRYTPLYLGGAGGSLRTASAAVVQFRPSSGAVPTAVDNTYTWNYNYGANTQFSIGGFPTNMANALLANDRSIGSASLQAFLTAGSLSGGSLQAGSCTGSTPALAADGGFCFSTPGNQNPCDTTYTFQYYVNDAWGVASSAATVTINAINCDQAPITANDPQGVNPTGTATQYQATEDILRTITATAPVNPPTPCGLASGLLCNDWDADNIPSPGPPGNMRVNGAPATRATVQAGSVNLDVNGGFIFTPAANFCGIDSFPYEAYDGIRAGNTANAYLAVACTSDAPTISADSYTMNEDCSATPINPASPCTATFNLACPAPSAAARGVLCNDADPDTNDDAGNGPNAAGTAGIGDAAGARDQAIQCTAAGQMPLHGTVTLATDGSFTYSPDVNYHGPDAFWYRIRDPGHAGGYDTACVQVQIDIASVIEDPEAVDDDRYNVPNVGATTYVAAAGVLTNDVNPDYLNQPPAYGGLTVTSWGPVTCPGAMGMSLTGTASDGRFTFNAPTSPGNFVGTCTFQYTISNGPNSDTGTVRLHVVTPSAPFAIQDACTLNEDPVPNNWPCAGNVFANDYAFPVPPGSAPVAVLDSPATIPGVGTLTLAANGAYSFAPVANWNGGVTFEYHFTQDSGSGMQTSPRALIAITVNSVNDAPILSDVTYACTDEDTVFTQAAAGGLLSLADDTHGGAPNENQLWTLYTPNRLRVVAQSLPIVTAKGTVTALNDDGSFTYLPDLNQAGADSFTYQVEDAGGTLFGGQDRSAVRTVNLCITPTPDAPVAEDDPTVGVYSTPNVLDLLIPASGPSLLFNDYDPDTPYTGDTLQYFDHTFVAVPGSGNTLGTPTANGGFVFNPGSEFVGTQTFQYRVRDNTGLVSNWATVTINVFYDQPPVAEFTPSSQSATTGTSVTFNDESFDLDSGDAITCWRWDFGDGATSAEQSPSHAFAAPGIYTVRLTVCDIYGVQSTTMHVVSVVRAMEETLVEGVSVGGGVQAPLASAGPDQTVLEGETVTLAGSSKPSSVTYSWRQVGPGPRVTLSNVADPAPTFVAPLLSTQAPVRLTFELRVSDGAATSMPDIVEVNVQPRNQPPQPSAGAGRSAWAGQDVILDATGTIDPDGNKLTYAWVQREGPQVNLTGADSAMATFRVPEGLAGNRLVFQLQVSDGKATVVDAVQVLILPKPSEASPLTHELVGSLATFRTTAVGTNYTWDFGDGQTLQTLVPEAAHSYTKPGLYTVEVTVTGPDGTKTYQDKVEVQQVEDKGRPVELESRAAWIVPVSLTGAIMLMVAALAAIFIVGRRQNE